MDYDYREAMRDDLNQAIDEKEEWIGKTITEAYDSKEEAYDSGVPHIRGKHTLFSAAGIYKAIPS